MPDRDDRLTTDDLSSHPDHEDGPRDSTAAEPDVDASRRDQPEETRMAHAEQPGGTQRDEPLMPPSDLQDYQRRWEQVQTGFVDEPRQAVQDADALVAEAMRQLADTFAAERKNLEDQWDRAGEVDTEALRVTLQRYRSFFNRLVST